jgi:hypothetical protein
MAKLLPSIYKISRLTNRPASLGGNLHRYVFGETPLHGRILSIPLYVVHYLM